MSDLLWPGDHRAADAFTDAAVVGALVRVEAAWAGALEERGALPAGTATALAAYVLPAGDLDTLAVEAEAGGNPVIPLLARLRTHVEAAAPGAGDRIHTGLTSQDVLDSALMLLSAEAADGLVAALAVQASALRRLAAAHAATPTLARSLGQPAQATAFGLRVLGWHDDVVAARESLVAWRSHVQVQLGGAVGDLAVATGLLGDPAQARAAVGTAAASLGMAPGRPWHTSRSQVTRLGDALVAATDAWGHLANDVVAMAAAGEVAEPAAPGRGASSAMAHKVNPVLAILLRRTATSTPLLLAQLHLAAAGSQEERSAGPWHTEWATLRTLWRRTLAAADQATELVTGLRVDPGRMRANLDAADVPAPGASAAGLFLDDGGADA